MAQYVLDRRGLMDRRPAPRTSLLQHIDVVLVLSTLVMAVLGALMVYSATRHLAGVPPTSYLKKQVVFSVLGLMAMVVVAAIDYHRFEEWSAIVYGAVVVGLLAVLSPVGTSGLGAQRWIPLGSFELQPSAFASLGVILASAVYCSRHEGELDLRRVLFLVIMAGVPILLVLKQPDLGTAIILTVITITVLVVSGAKARYLSLLAALAVLGIFLVVHLGLLQSYQIQRLTVFLHQGKSSGHAAQTAYYNLNQSKNAIGSGGTLGKGLFNGSQTNLSYVPEQQTDFIFTALGEQLGFVGTASVLALFGVMLWRILRTAQLARDPLGRYLCVGVLALIGFSVFQNAGMTMGIMPITGVPLPFMSYGGSATIAFFAAVGLVLNVGMRRFR